MIIIMIIIIVILFANHLKHRSRVKNAPSFLHLREEVREVSDKFSRFLSHIDLYHFLRRKRERGCIIVMGSAAIQVCLV